MLGGLLRGVGRVLVQGVAIVVLSATLLELLVAGSFRYPAWSPLPRPVLRQMHVLFDRNTIQAMPECARYDDTLTYTLRPGQCTFSNREFTTRFEINALGFRDDAASLDRPEIIVLGDSLAMGWGVDQDAAFPSVVERLTGRRTLNAGVSSYGTVRELRALERVDRRAVTDVVIQYSSNDLDENEALTAGRFKTLTREAYEHTVLAQAEMRRYHPGKHALNLLVMLRNLALQRGVVVTPPSRRHEVEVFLEVLARSPVDLTSYAVTVLSLDGDFIEAVRPLAAASPVPAIARLHFVDASPIASLPGAFYVLDDHPTRIGQHAIGRALADALSVGDTP